MSDNSNIPAMAEGVVESKEVKSEKTGNSMNGWLGKAGWESSQASGERTRGSPGQAQDNTTAAIIIADIGSCPRLFCGQSNAAGLFKAIKTLKRAIERAWCCARGELVIASDKARPAWRRGKEERENKSNKK